jgi:hypothetical protein
MSTNLETILSTTLFNFVKKENKSINLVELKKASPKASVGVDLLVRNYGDYLDADEIRPAIDTISSIGGLKDKIDLLPENLSSPDTYIESESETVNALVQYSNSGTESKLTKEKAEEIVKKAQSNSPQGFDTMLSVSSSVKSNIVIPQPIITNTQNQVSLPSDDNKDKTLRDPDTNQPFSLRDIEIKLDNLEIGGQKLIGLDKKTAEYLTQNGRIQNVKITVGRKEIDTQFAFVLEYDTAGKVSGINLRMNSAQLPTTDFTVTGLSIKADDNESTPITLNSSIKANDRKLQTKPELLIEINPNQQTQQSNGTSSDSRTIDLTFSPDEQRSVLTLSKAFIDKVSQCTDPMEEVEVLIRNLLKILDKRFLLMELYSPLTSLLPNFLDGPTLQYALASVTISASNYIGKVVSTAPQGEGSDGRDRLLGGALSEVKSLIKGNQEDVFNFNVLGNAIKAKGYGDSKKLIDKILELKPKSDKDVVSKGQVIKVIQEYALTLPIEERNNLLSSLDLGVDDLMVNYALQRMKTILSNRISSIEAAQTPIREAVKSLNFSNLLYSK